MASTYSTLGRLEIMAPGEKDAVWGDITSSNLQLLEQMAHGYESIDISTGPNYTLTTLNGANDQGRKKILKFTGAQTAVTVTVPPVSHVYVVWNAGNFDIVFRTVSNTGPTVSAQTKTIIFCDGSLVSTLSGIATTPFSVSLLDDPDALTARGTIGVPGLVDDSTRNLFTQQFPVEFRWNDSSASAGPVVVIFRDSGTPAANDVCGSLAFRGRDSTAAVTSYGALLMQILDPVARTGRLSLKSVVGGVFDDRLFIGNGAYTRNVSDMGIDTINALRYYANGVQLSTVLGYLDYREEQPQNTDGGTFTSGAWQTRTLNVEAYDTGGFGSLVGNQITLAAGTYEALIRCPASTVNSHQCRLQNISDGTTTLVGTSEFSGTGAVIGSTSVASGRFTIASPKVFEVQHRCSTTRTTTGFGQAANFGTELYTVAKFWKQS